MWASITWPATALAVAMGLSALATYFAACEDASENSEEPEQNTVSSADALVARGDMSTQPVASRHGEKRAVNQIGRPESNVLPGQANDLADEFVRTVFLSHLSSDLSRMERVHKAKSWSATWMSHYLSKIMEDQSDYDRLVTSFYEQVVTAKRQRFETFYRHTMEALILDRAPQASSPFEVSGAANRFVVNVGPVKIVVTEEETTVEVLNPKVTSVNLIQPQRPAETVATGSTEATLAPVRSRVLH